MFDPYRNGSWDDPSRKRQEQTEPDLGIRSGGIDLMVKVKKDGDGEAVKLEFPHQSGFI